MSPVTLLKRFPAARVQNGTVFPAADLGRQERFSNESTVTCQILLPISQPRHRIGRLQSDAMTLVRVPAAPVDFRRAHAALTRAASLPDVVRIQDSAEAVHVAR